MCERTFKLQLSLFSSQPHTSEVRIVAWEFGPYGFKIRENSRILHFFKIRWNSLDVVTTVGLWRLTNENGIEPMHMSVESLHPWDWSYPVLQYLRVRPTPTVVVGVGLNVKC